MGGLRVCNERCTACGFAAAPSEPDLTVSSLNAMIACVRLIMPILYCRQTHTSPSKTQNPEAPKVTALHAQIWSPP